MPDAITVRVGLESARELELVVDDADAFATQYEKAVKGKDQILWVTDAYGHRFGLTLSTVAFVEIVKPTDRGVGF